MILPQAVPKAFVLRGEAPSCKSPGAVLAYRNRCPHLKIPLEWQEDNFFCKDTDLLRCATHGALFLPENGQCVSGPCAGQALEPLDLAQRRDGLYWRQTAD